MSAPAGYRVVLLTVGDDAPTATLVAAVRDWAEETRADLRVVHADDDMIDGAVRAMDLNPDLIISAGDALVDPLATVTANHLDRQFLIVGAELAEPTENVTAADWTGAAYRGEGLGTAAAYDPGRSRPSARGRRCARGSRPCSRVSAASCSGSTDPGCRCPARRARARARGSGSERAGVSGATTAAQGDEPQP